NRFRFHPLPTSSRACNSGANLFLHYVGFHKFIEQRPPLYLFRDEWHELSGTHCTLFVNHVGEPNPWELGVQFRYQYSCYRDLILSTLYISPEFILWYFPFVKSWNAIVFP